MLTLLGAGALGTGALERETARLVCSEPDCVAAIGPSPIAESGLDVRIVRAGSAARVLDTTAGKPAPAAKTSHAPKVQPGQPTRVLWSYRGTAANINGAPLTKGVSKLLGGILAVGAAASAPAAAASLTDGEKQLLGFDLEDGRSVSAYQFGGSTTVSIEIKEPCGYIDCLWASVEGIPFNLLGESHPIRLTDLRSQALAEVFRHRDVWNADEYKDIPPLQVPLKPGEDRIEYGGVVYIRDNNAGTIRPVFLIGAEGAEVSSNTPAMSSGDGSSNGSVASEGDSEDGTEEGRDRREPIPEGTVDMPFVGPGKTWSGDMYSTLASNIVRIDERLGVVAYVPDAFHDDLAGGIDLHLRAEPLNQPDPLRNPMGRPVVVPALGWTRTNDIGQGELFLEWYPSLNPREVPHIGPQDKALLVEDLEFVTAQLATVGAVPYDGRVIREPGSNRLRWVATLVSPITDDYDHVAELKNDILTGEALEQSAAEYSEYRYMMDPDGFQTRAPPFEFMYPQLATRDAAAKMSDIDRMTLDRAKSPDGIWAAVTLTQHPGYMREHSRTELIRLLANPNVLFVELLERSVDHFHPTTGAILEMNADSLSTAGILWRLRQGSAQTKLSAEDIKRMERDERQDPGGEGLYRVRVVYRNVTHPSKFDIETDTLTRSDILAFVAKAPVVAVELVRDRILRAKPELIPTPAPPLEGLDASADEPGFAGAVAVSDALFRALALREDVTLHKDKKTGVLEEVEQALVVLVGTMRHMSDAPETMLRVALEKPMDRIQRAFSEGRIPLPVWGAFHDRVETWLTGPERPSPEEAIGIGVNAAGAPVQITGEFSVAPADAAAVDHVFGERARVLPPRGYLFRQRALGGHARGQFELSTDAIMVDESWAGQDGIEAHELTHYLVDALGLITKEMVEDPDYRHPITPHEFLAMTVQLIRAPSFFRHLETEPYKEGGPYRAFQLRFNLHRKTGLEQGLAGAELRAFVTEQLRLEAIELRQRLEAGDRIDRIHAKSGAFLWPGHTP